MYQLTKKLIGKGRLEMIDVVISSVATPIMPPVKSIKEILIADATEPAAYHNPTNFVNSPITPLMFYFLFHRFTVKSNALLPNCSPST
jgi:hypothetical protein